MENSWDDIPQKGKKLAIIFKRLNTLAKSKYKSAISGNSEALDQFLRIAELMRAYAKSIAEIKVANKNLEDFDARLKALEVNQKNEQ